MNPLFPLLGLAGGLSPPAWAADIDEIAASDLALPAAPAAPDLARHRSGRAVRTTVQHRAGATRAVRRTTTVIAHPRHPVVHHHGPVRPVVVHTAPVRPVVVHVAPRPPVTVVHVAPPVRNVYYTSGFRSGYPYAYRPPAHVTYLEETVLLPPPSPVVEAPPAAVISTVEEPRPGLDRANTLALGLVGGSLLSSSPVSGKVYGDPGLGLVGRYRPAEVVGLELGLSHHTATFSFDEQRSQTQLGGQVLLFAFPRGRVSPFLLGGATFNAADMAGQVSETETLELIDGQWGLDGGLGVELAVGESFAVDLEGKYIGWLDERYAGEAPGAFQATAGLLYHFR